MPIYCHVAIISSGCPPDWKYTEKSCYILIKEETDLPWVDAKSNCETMGANLVSISNRQEMLAVHQLILMEDVEGDIYIGTYTTLLDSPHLIYDLTL